MAVDFFASTYCQRKKFWQRRRVARFFDALFDRRIAAKMCRLRRKAEQLPRRDVLVASVAVPARATELAKVFAAFRRSRHRVSVCEVPMADHGKFDNINRVLNAQPIDTFDWLIITDDDVRLPPDFLDIFLYAAEALELKIAQPAHRCLSYTTFTFNYRLWNSLGRVTHFVESGPITAFHRDAIPHVLPFPALRWAWGTDIAWSVKAEREGMAIGIVDCTPIEHLKAVASGYRVDPAVEEARGFLAASGMARSREEMFVNVRVLREV